MEGIAQSHELRVIEECPTAIFQRQTSIERKSWAGREPEQTILRVGHIHAGYKGPEYSLYIEHPKGVLLLVLFCPERKRQHIFAAVEMGRGESFADGHGGPAS